MSPRSIPQPSTKPNPQRWSGWVTGLTVSGLASALIATAGPGLAQETALLESGSARSAQSGPCVEVDIGGQRTGNLECLNQRLRTRSIDQRQASSLARALSIPDPNDPGPSLGLTNDAAFRQRMGGNYGIAIRPLRPPPATYAPTFPRSPQ